MNVTLLRHTEAPEELCGQAAATCYESKNYASALHHAVGSGHTSVLEHAVFTFKIEGLSRAALAQLTRHRLASFDVKSQRYVKVGKGEYVIPDSIVKAGMDTFVRNYLSQGEELYNQLIEAGVPAEDARFITPQATTTDLVMTMNCRELLHFFSLRTCNRAQWEIRELADKMLKICKEKAPGIFENAGPGCVTGKCPELRPCRHPRSKEAWDE